jgi:hypothetical protein
MGIRFYPLSKFVQNAVAVVFPFKGESNVSANTSSFNKGYKWREVSIIIHIYN